ncbi:Arc family DNA-binding protein [Paraburkholderia hospita]|uniref:Arc family DNA-binding protein n=1 Tax=Paraburkholderia hospita TaxID=169430 RepID=UPI003ECFE15D
MTRQVAPYPVRFVKEGLREQLAASAQANQRSLNAEINVRLMLSLQIENARLAATSQALVTQ